MIAWLSGVLQDKALDRLVLDVGGVGYELHVSTQTLAELPRRGEKVQLFCHTHVREDALQLFGFFRQEERRAFELLISVSGIGPRLALTILSGMDVESLARAVAEGDHKRLQGVPGIGKKTAERLVLELRERFGQAVAAAPDGRTRAAGLRAVEHEVVAALVNLGYKQTAAEKAVEQALEAQADGSSSLAPEELLRLALGAIAGAG